MVLPVMIASFIAKEVCTVHCYIRLRINSCQTVEFIDEEWVFSLKKIMIVVF
jgi:hypothetical protein